MADENKVWPEFSYEQWKDTYQTLHMWMQIVGKVKLKLCPFLNEWWQVAFYLTARGMTTSTIPYQDRVFEVNFDFIAHELTILVNDGSSQTLPLEPQSVAIFYAKFMDALKSLGIHVSIWKQPVEVSNTIAFDQDDFHASYDGESAHRFWQILLQVQKVFADYRSDFFGKSSPIHFFWGACDLAYTRFSGKPAPERAGADRMMRIAMDQEEISFGFWPGNDVLPFPVFYAYAYPEPPGFTQASIKPTAAYYEPSLKEFILKYEDVRNSPSPQSTLLEFLQSTYENGASLAKWDRKMLERKVE